MSKEFLYTLLDSMSVSGHEIPLQKKVIEEMTPHCDKIITDYTGNVNMWQYTSKGTVPGISGWVDMNIAYFNYGTVAEPKHTHDYNEEVKNSYVLETCGKDGSKVMACSCGDKETVVIKATGKHTWGDWDIVLEATDTENGKKVRICEVCKKEETKEYKKSDENTNTNTNINTNTTQGDGNNTVGNNTVTNTVPDKPTHTHTWEEVSQDKATCTQNGIIYYKCSDSTCSETKEDKESLKANGHTYVDGICTECKEKDPNYKPEGSEGSNDDEIPSNTQETNEV